MERERKKGREKAMQTEGKREKKEEGKKSANPVRTFFAVTDVFS